MLRIPKWLIAAALAAGGVLEGAVSPHPRIWLDASKLAQVRAKVIAGDPAWTALKSQLDIRLNGCSVYPAGFSTPDAVASQGPAFALGYAVAASMTAGERSTYGLTAYLSWADCAIKLAHYSAFYYGGLRRAVFNGDGVATEFTLANPLFFQPYRIIRTNGGVKTTYNWNGAGDIGRHGTDSGFHWYWDKGTATIRQSGSAAALGSGETLEVFYHGPFSECISGTHLTPVANDGTYGYFAGSTWATTTDIKCSYIPLPTALQANGGNEFRNNAWIVSVIFDWCYDRLTGGERTSLASFLRAAAWQQSDLGPYRPYLIGQGQGLAANIAAGQVSRMALIGIATHGDNPSDSGDRNYEIDKAIGWWKGYGKGLFSAAAGTYPDLAGCGEWTSNCLDDETRSGYGGHNGSSAGGAFPEGPEYSAQASFYILQLLEAVRTASVAGGIDLRSDVSDLPGDLARWIVHSSAPGGSQMVPYGDLQGYHYTVLSDWRTSGLYVSEVLGEDIWGKHVRQWLDETFPDTPSELYRWVVALYRSQGWSKEAYAASTDYRAAGQEVVTVRSDWTEESSWWHFHSGSRWINHQHYNAGNFGLFRNGAWASIGEIGYGVAAFSSHSLYNVLSYLLDQDTVSRGPHGVLADSPAVFTRAVLNPPGGGYAYLRTDLAGQYNCAVCGDSGKFDVFDSYFRDFLVIKPDVVVVIDRLRMSQPGTVRFQLQARRNWNSTSRRQWSISGAQASIVTGNATGSNISTTDKNTLYATALHASPAMVSEDRNGSGPIRYSQYSFEPRVARLNGALDETATAIPINGYINDGGYSYPTVLQVDAEKIRVCSCTSCGAVAAPTLNVCTDGGGGRGFGGTTPASHGANAPLFGFHFNETLLSSKTVAAGVESWLGHVVEGRDAGEAATPLVALSSVSASHTGVEIGVSNPHIAVMGVSGDAGSLSFTTSAFSGTGQFYITALAPGNYEVLHNSAHLVSGVVAAGSGMLRFSGPAGSYSLTSDQFTVETASLPPALVGVPYQAQLSAVGGSPPYTWSVVSGSLPAGLTLSGSTGEISGTPTGSAPVTFTVRAADQAAATADAVLTIVAEMNILRQASIPDAILGTPYSLSFDVQGGAPPVGWEVENGQLPPGLTLSGPTLSGTPGAVGDWAFTLRAVDATGLSDEYAITIRTVTSASDLDLLVRAAGSGSVVRLRRNGLPASVTCRVVYRSADGILVSAADVPPGGGVRVQSLEGFPPGSYNVEASCGSTLGGTGAFSSQPATGQDGVSVSLRPPANLNAASARISFGPTQALGSTVTIACTAGCTATLPGLSRGAVHWIRHEWVDGSGAVIVAGQVTPLLVH